MSDIDHKLREILFANSIAFVTRPKDYDIILDEKGLHESIAQIKQVFAENNNQRKYASSYMTGQEWYDRFEKELSDEKYGNTNPTDKVDCESIPYICTCDLLDAAKKASGLDNVKENDK